MQEDGKLLIRKVPEQAIPVPVGGSEGGRRSDSDGFENEPANSQVTIRSNENRSNEAKDFVMPNVMQLLGRNAVVGAFYRRSRRLICVNEFYNAGVGKTQAFTFDSTLEYKDYYREEKDSRVYSNSTTLVVVNEWNA
jgi:hypothetical protein